MLPLADPGLDPPTERGLRKYQEEVDRVEPYAARVETGKRLFTRSRPQAPLTAVERSGYHPGGGAPAMRDDSSSIFGRARRPGFRGAAYAADIAARGGASPC